MALIPALDLSTSGQPVAALGPTAGQREESGNVVEDFANMFATLVRQTNTAQKTADDALARLAAGDPVQLHQVMLQVQEASLLTQLTLQVRNKVIEAYQEIIRMQV
jgi:flagellar hook-basal body complex protein FliE